MIICKKYIAIYRINKVILPVSKLSIERLTALPQGCIILITHYRCKASQYKINGG